MKMREHVSISVLEYSSRKIVHAYVFMVALRCNLLIVSFTAVSLTVMVNADNMQIIQQTAVLVFVLPFLIPLQITLPTPASDLAQ
jgi:hypothetical protein